MAIDTIFGGQFQDSSGKPLNGGSIMFQPLNSATVTGTDEQVVQGVPVVATLDANGNVPNINLWGSDQLTPNTAYKVSIYGPGSGTCGTPVRSEYWSIVGASPIDLGLMTTTSAGVSYPGVVLLNPGALQNIANYPLRVPLLQVGSAGDTGLSRSAAGVVNIGNGVQGDSSGSLRMTNLYTTVATVSASANPASSGTVRLANADAIKWRDAANAGDYGISLQPTAGNLNSNYWYFRDSAGSGIGQILVGSVAADGSSTTIAASGFIRMHSGDSIAFRNNANSADISISKDSSDNLTLSGFPQVNAATVNGTGYKISNGAAASGHYLRGNGTNFVDGTIQTGDIPSRTGTITVGASGAGSAISFTGVFATVYIPVACTITAWTILADAAGSAVIDVLTSTYAGYGTTSSICASDKPTLSSVIKNQNTNPSTWTTSVAAGTCMQFNLNSSATVKSVTLTLTVSIPYA